MTMLRSLPVSPDWNLQTEDSKGGGSPPKLAPISGVLSSSSEYLVRPVAHRPSLSSWSSPSTGYVSGGSCSSSEESSTSRNGPEDILFLLQEEEDDDVAVDKKLTVCSPSSILADACFWRVSRSPSGASESSSSTDLESLLKEKVAEISNLRKTLEKNEQVIVKVYAEKEQIWKKELDKVKAQYETQLETSKSETEKAKKLLQYHRSRLTSLDDLEEAFRVPHQPKRHLPVRGWRQSLALPSKIVENLKTLDDVVDDVTQRSFLISTSSVAGNMSSSLRDLKETSAARDRLLNYELEAMRTELNRTKLELEETRETVREDRARWQEERDRVACYQEQLHQNYVQAWRRSRTLESQVEEMGTKIEKLMTRDERPINTN